MNNIIGSNHGCQDRVGFKSLMNLFDVISSPTTVSNLAHDLNIPEMNHFLDTKVTEEAELCRRVLMLGCQSDKTFLRRKIDSQDQSILALYRGFSRFML
jgi:pyoverdine/dityrosine biosynthesis protein Dit1